MNEITKIDTAPSDLLTAAIVAVMKEVKRLEKADQNTFGKYAFTSIDDFKDAVRPLMAKNGLSVSVNETSFDFMEVASGKDRSTTIAKYQFSIRLRHEAGGETEPECLTIALPFTGAQSAGAARSYALKEWMKGRFLVSTGDIQDEADERDNSTFIQARQSKADARDTWTALEKGIRDVISYRDRIALEDWWAENKVVIQTMPLDWEKTIKATYADEWKKLKALEDDEAAGNSPTAA